MNSPTTSKLSGGSRFSLKKQNGSFFAQIILFTHLLNWKFMNKGHDFIASNDAVFDGRLKNLLPKLGDTGTPASRDIPQQDYDNLLPAQADWDVRYAAAKNPNDRTHAQVTAKNERRLKPEGVHGARLHK
jgi:hypothetical protein